MKNSILNYIMPPLGIAAIVGGLVALDPNLQRIFLSETQPVESRVDDSYTPSQSSVNTNYKSSDKKQNKVYKFSKKDCDRKVFESGESTFPLSDIPKSRLEVRRLSDQGIKSKFKGLVGEIDAFLTANHHSGRVDMKQLNCYEQGYACLAEEISKRPFGNKVPKVYGPKSDGTPADFEDLVNHLVSIRPYEL